MTWPNASWPNASWPDIFWPNASWPSDVGSTAYITVNDITVAEDAGIATFTVTRSGDTSGVSSVDYATSNDSYPTAGAGNDYVATSGTLTFTAGQTSKTVDVTVNNTANYEISEYFWLNLSNPVNAVISKAKGICTLTDVSGFPSADSVTNPTASEGNNITFRVTFPRVAEFSTAHTYVLGGTATAGVDYNFTPVTILNNVGTSASSISATSSGGSFTCPVNTSWVDITFALLTDADVDAGETIILTVDGTASGTGTINDPTPSDPLSFATNAWLFNDIGDGVVNISDSISGVAPTFTRTTTAATKLSTGLWKLDVPIDTPRSYYHTDGLAYFISEPAATQLLTAGSTRDLTNAAWVATNITAVKDQTGIDGVANSASKLTASGASATLKQTITAAASSRTFSAFVKRITGTGSVFLRQIGGTTSSLDITSLINSSTWTLVQLNASQLNAQCTFELATAGDVIAVDCVQFEAGAIATTPIPAAGTRGYDLLLSNKSITDTFWLKVSWVPFDLSSANGGMIVGTGHTGDSIVALRRVSASPHSIIAHDGTAQRNILTAKTLVAGVRYKTAVTANSSTSVIKGAHEGVLGADQSYDNSMPYPMIIGNRRAATSAPLNGLIRDMYYGNTAMSDADMALITAADAVPTVTSVSSPNVNEGSSLVYSVTLSNSYGSTSTFLLSAAGTATASVDYTNSPTFSNGVTNVGGTLTVPIGVSAFTVTYPTLTDATIDGVKTLNVTVGGVTGYGIIYDIDGIGDSGSTYAASSQVVSVSSTTPETINTNDFMTTGAVYIAPPASGTITKTVHKVGASSSLVKTKSKIGYVRLSGSSTGPRLKIGNADLSLSKSHAIGMLIRMDNAQLSSYSGRIQLLKTTQTDGTNNYLSMFIGGATGTPTYRNLLSMERAGFGGVKYEVCASSSGTSGFTISMFGNATSNKWVWVWVFGRDPAVDAASNETTLTYTGSTGFHQTNVVNLAHSLHGVTPGARSIAVRKAFAPSYGPTGITPMAFDGADGSLVDFVLGSSNDGSTKTVDIARIIKLNTATSLDKIAAMCAGQHPESLKVMSGDDFCIDFSTFSNLPANVTELGTGHSYTPVDDGPEVTTYHGTNSSDVVLNIVNKRVT